MTEADADLPTVVPTPDTPTFSAGLSSLLTLSS
eukprot:CAMPEP_0174236458 /NCGR_PEP_ID=MMETSP0417-20130205/5590_1 /TAXON_ID=242541 /ORGANISM="Mayorella sp, Strain BSH-02190019" /LENGTH=32 /DNA_ID= /DNA_START= /DNA_END= /DNA_ORIENTATION=